VYGLTRQTRASALCALAFAFLVQSLTAARAEDVPPPFAIQASRSDPERPVRPQGQRYRGPVFDTHTHLPFYQGGVALPATVLAAMKTAGVARLVLMPVPNAGRVPQVGVTLKGMDAVRRQSSGTVQVLCGSDYLTAWMHDAAALRRTPGDIDRQMARLSRDLEGSACAGVGEIGFRHYIKAPGELLIDIPAGYPALLAIAETAARANRPLEIHAEPVEPDGRRHDAEVLGTLALLAALQQNLTLIVSHTGMTNPANASALLLAGANVMMNINPAAHKGPVDWLNLEPVTNQERELYEDWAALFEELSDRFMIGSDFFFGYAASVADEYERRIRHIRQMLGSLRSSVAQRIASDNAERVYGRALP